MHFIIAGSINCPQFTYAVMVAQRLKENLPDFTFVKMPMKPADYKNWLTNTCKENKWYHVQSPIIWREIGLKKGKKDLIGDINKFLDLCYDYYGIPQDILSAEQFNRDEMNWFTKRTESEYFEQVKVDAHQRRHYRSRQVCITGAGSQITEILIMQLLELDLQRRENGLEIRLFDEPTKVKRLSSATMDARFCPGLSGFGNCRVTNTLRDAVFNVDLVIVLDIFARKPNETVVKWLKRNRNAMCALGKALKKYAPPHCRVILGGPSNQPLCYNATVLASFATNLHVRNIVAVTQDLGRQMLKMLSAKTKVPIKHFYCPPVWGFVGLSKFIDIRKTLQTYLYKLPSKNRRTSFPTGPEEYQLRTCECLLNEEEEGELHKSVLGQKVEAFQQIGRWPTFAKATAIIDLLKVWGIKQEDGNGEILCLGVYSDGTFNIPQGIYWSQPVILSNGFWVPFAEYPIPRSPYFNLYYLFMFSVAALYRTKIKPRIYISPSVKTKKKEKQKFNFDKILEEVGMPVIRTDHECVTYLKYLTKTELGIDLDEVREVLKEEDEEERQIKSKIVPPEEVTKKQIYCECWRQELKELQKFAFDHSSTTEVEVDLSENVSGSEFSVINKPSKSESIKKDPSVAVSEEEYLGEGSKKSQEYPERSYSASSECLCGLLPTGSLCKCLGAPEKQKEKLTSDDEKLSTQHFYKEQNAEIFEDDLKDVIYEDTFNAKKKTTFVGDSKEEDGPGPVVKFYGIKDTVRDPETRLQMQKRIARYEREWEASSEGDLRSAAGETDRDMSASKKSSHEFAAEAVQIDINFIPENSVSGGESLKESRSEDSRKGLSISGEGETTPYLTVPYGSAKSEESFPIPGEADDQYLTSRSSYKESSGEAGERLVEDHSTKSLEEELYAIWGESAPYDLSDNETEGGSLRKKKKREGIPLCCLCRCVIPEGLTICPCGETTVVEVFKKESVEVFIQNEDDMDYIVEYVGKEVSSLAGQDEDLSMGKETLMEYEYFDQDEEEDTKTCTKLPPESFFPFYPKPDNKFKESKRPFELTKEYHESSQRKEFEIPRKCEELLNITRRELEEGSMMGEETEEYESGGETGEESLAANCDGLEQIKTDFSDLKMFVPCGLEDWRVTVQRKYQEWFFQGPKIKDETYYDITIEDISEDEFELDEELEKFFEV